MGKVYDVPWTIQETKERVTVTLDEEGYATFVRLRDAIVRDGVVLVEGEERARAVAEIDALMCAFYYFDGVRMLADGERRSLFGDADAASPLVALAEIQALEEAYPLFRIPQKAKDEIARAGGQTTLIAPEGTTALPMPREGIEDLRDDPEPPAWSTPSTVSAPDSAASRLPDFDGETYWRALDHERLGKQLLRVGRQMADGQWHTLAEVSAVTGDPEASVSARLRDLRKRKFGGHTVNRERMEGGLWRYRLVREAFATPWGDEDEAAVA